MSPRRVQPLATDAIERYRHAYLHQIDILQEAADEVRTALDDAGDARRALRAHIESGGLLSDLESVIEPIPLRKNLGVALEELERARHTAQCLVFRLLYAEGRSMTEIASVWGVSRQLVSRLINEPT